MNPKISTLIDSSTQVYGVFGNPVSHSLSPLLHNAVFKELGMNCIYLAFEIQEQTLGIAFEGIRSKIVRGVNLTIPFKEEALNFIDEIPEDIDRGVGAINTVVNKDDKLFGYNTDVPGFLQAITNELEFKPAGKTVLVLGAGGAARAVAFALAYSNAERILLSNRNFDRAVGLAEYLADYFPESDIEAIASLDNIAKEKPALIVNASACGLKGSDPVSFDLKALNNAPSVYDLIYSPKETKLLKEAKSLGFKAANGLGMLVNQAALSFTLWTGKKEGVREKMLEVLKNANHN